MALAVILAGWLTAPGAPALAQKAAVDLAARKAGPITGLPTPRFVSLKADEVNVRRGPGWDHAVAWVFHRAGLPVEVIAEFDVWREVRDSEGATGWVAGTLLSGRRTVLVAPWEDKSTPSICMARRANPRPSAQNFRPACSAMSIDATAAGVRSRREASLAISARISFGASIRAKRSIRSVRRTRLF